MKIRKHINIIETEEDLLIKERKIEISIAVDRLMRMKRKRHVKKIKSIFKVD